MRRLHEFDALRSFCMLYGIFFHAHSVSGFWLSTIIFEASAYFRMSTFYFVSAFLTAMLLDRRGVTATLRSRSVALAVPLAAAFLTLVPLAKWGQFSLAAPAGNVSFGDLDLKVITFDVSGAYLHLWFLVVLLVYLLTAPVLVHAMRQAVVARVLGRIAGTVPLRARFLVLALAVGAACALSMTIREILLPDRAMTSLVVFGCFFNFPFYVMGIAAFVFREQFGRLIRFDLPAICAGLACAFLLTLGPDVPDPVRWVGTGMANAVAALSLTALFARFTRQGPLLAFLSRSIYSVYLVHFTFIFLFGLLFARLGAEGAMLYCLIVAATLPSCFLFHEMIERSRWLTFLFNGKMSPPSIASPAPALHGGLAR